MKREINIPNQDKLINFFKNHKNINTVYIFGSHGTEYENNRSDIDLGILFSKPPEILRQMNLETEIEETIGQEVDIVSLNKCNILLKYKVIKEGEKIYEQDEIKTADFIENVLKHYFDYGMKLKHFREDFKEGLREESQ